MRGQVDEQLALSTLATKTVVATNFDEVAIEKTFVSSIVVVPTMQEFSEALGDGPIMIGVAHSDYTVTEIKEWIENSGSWDQGDMISKERNSRLIRRLGTFTIVDSTASGSVPMGDGKPIKLKLKWTLTTGDTLQLWAYNLGASALATTDPQIFLEGHANLWM